MPLPGSFWKKDFANSDSANKDVGSDCQILRLFEGYFSPVFDGIWRSSGLLGDAAGADACGHAQVQGAGADLMAFEFSETYEVVPGEWRFMVFQGDRLLAEQSFEVR